MGAGPSANEKPITTETNDTNVTTKVIEKEEEKQQELVEEAKFVLLPRQPKVTSLVDALSKIKELEFYVKDDPMTDEIIIFENGITVPLSSAEKQKTWIAGSYALRHLIDNLMNQSEIKQSSKDWMPGDCDIFTLGNEKNALFTANHKTLDDNETSGKMMDLVQKQENNVEELLLSFDLPCARVAFDAQGRIAISLQCLCALLTGRYYLPHIYYSIKNFNGNILYHNFSQDWLNCSYERLHERINKYKKRGFTPIYYQTPPETIKAISKNNIFSTWSGYSL